MKQQLHKKVIKSVQWSALSEIASKILPPFFYIVTARLLTPEDFGIVATSGMVIAFASIIWEAGLSKALIQSQDYSNLQIRANIVFYTNIFLSSIIYILLILFSDFIASFFHDKRISNVLIVSGISLIIGSFMSVQTALLQKEFEFKKLFYIRLIGSVIPGIVSVVMAYLGYGYWALVLGNIASMALRAIILWNISYWRPSMVYDISLAKEMFAFSKWILLSGLLSWFFLWGDMFIVGFYFSQHELGLYRTGNYFVSTVIGLITTPILPVMYSYFSKIQNDIESVKKVLLFSSKMVSFFVLPVGVGIFIVKTPLIDLIFGEKWQGLDFVVGYLALMHSASWIIGLNNSAYNAIGRPDIETKILISTLLLYLIGYILSAQISFEAFIISRFLLAVGAIGFHIYASKKIFDLGYLKTISNIKLIFFILSFIVLIYILSEEFINKLIFNILFLLISILIYLLTIYILDNIFIYKILNIVKEFKK